MTTTQARDSKIVTIRGKAFGGEGVKQHKCMVDVDGTVRVYDSVAGHYTTCHVLAAAAVRRAQRAAASMH